MIFLSTGGPRHSLGCVPTTILTLALAAAAVLSLTLLAIESVDLLKPPRTSLDDDVINVITGTTAIERMDPPFDLSPPTGLIVDDDFIPAGAGAGAEEEAVAVATTEAAAAVDVVTGVTILSIRSRDSTFLSFEIKEDLGLFCDCFIKSAKLISPWEISSDLLLLSKFFSREGTVVDEDDRKEVEGRES